MWQLRPPARHRKPRLDWPWPMRLGAAMESLHFCQVRLLRAPLSLPAWAAWLTLFILVAAAVFGSLPSFRRNLTAQKLAASQLEHGR